jgi:DASH complex subunit Duo1
MADRKTGLFDTLEHEDLDESLWDSPVKPTPKSKDQSSKAAQSERPSYEDQEVRDQALRQELVKVRKVNETIEGVLQSLDRAKENMGVSY